jgi:RNA polymerase sigma-70 factor (ECF subfamily)
MLGKDISASSLVGTLLKQLDGLYIYAVHLCLNDEDAEYLVEEAYSRTVRTMDSLEEGSKLKVQLFTTLRDIWFKELEKRRHVTAIVEMEGKCKSNVFLRVPNDMQTSPLERKQVRQAVLTLPAEFREIIVLRYQADLAYKEIAVVLNCALGTVMARAMVARAKLRALLLYRHN